MIFWWDLQQYPEKRTVTQLLHTWKCNPNKSSVAFQHTRFVPKPKRSRMFQAIASILSSLLRMSQMNINWTETGALATLFCLATRQSFDTSTPRSFMYFWKSWTMPDTSRRLWLYYFSSPLTNSISSPNEMRCYHVIKLQSFPLILAPWTRNPINHHQDMTYIAA